MCQVFEVSKSSYYSWRKNPVGKWKQKNRKITDEIKVIHESSKKIYGSPRIAYALADKGYSVSRPRVARLMRQAGIRSVLRRKYVVTTDSKHDHKAFENLVDRQFSPGQTGKVWVSDITYIHTLKGWCYLTTIIDIGDRSVIGWSVSNTLKADETVMIAWKAAMAKRPISMSLIFHSDRGVQYACDAFTELLSHKKLVRQSMSRKGDCWDNAVAESFFKTLKAEWVNRFVYRDLKHVELSMFEYIETFYNTKRAHSTLGYLSPQQYAAQLTNNRKAA